MPVNAYPTMDQRGWVTDPNQKALAIINDYIGSNHSQSNTFLGYVKSIHYALQQNPNDIGGFCRAVQNDLTDFATSYMDGVVVDVGFQPSVDRLTQRIIDTRFDIQIGLFFDTPTGRGSLHGAITVENKKVIGLFEVEQRQ